MRLVFIADTFPPMRSSGAVQLRDLVRELIKDGHEITVLLPDPSIKSTYYIDHFEGAKVLRLKCLPIKDVGMIRRTLGELIMPYSMRLFLSLSPLGKDQWDAIVWYSPSIFHTPLVKSLKKRLGCKTYLIIRDIFPQWALDMGLMKPNLIYRFFTWIAQKQFKTADIIGVQSPGNLIYFEHDNLISFKLETLQNWVGKAVTSDCEINISSSKLSGRKVMVYAGNMGVAQNLEKIIDLATNMENQKDIGFLFVGRGSHAERLKQITIDRNLSNTLFYDEIDPDSIPMLYRQCAGGIISLDHRHKSHNIPGKFLTYIQAGLPVFANVNLGNDLTSIIHSNEVGVCCESQSLEDLTQSFESFIKLISANNSCQTQCKKLYELEYTSEIAAQKIIAALQG